MNYADWAKLEFAARRLNAEQLAALDAIAAAIPKIGPRATQLLVETAEGLVIGVDYGDWEPGRNRVREARHEARDGRLYVTDELKRARERVVALEAAQQSFTNAHAALALADSVRPPAEPMFAGGE